jgi:hypothetical protein
MTYFEDAEKEGTVVEAECDCGTSVKATVLGENGGLLEWYCPTCKEMKRDVNA